MTADAIRLCGWMIASQCGAVTIQALFAIMPGLIGRLAVQIMAGAAPQTTIALFPTQAAAQLLRLANDLQRRVVARIANEYGKGLFQCVAGHEIVPVFCRIENACVSLEMALLADAVSGVWRETARVDDIGARRPGHMVSPGPWQRSHEMPSSVTAGFS